MRLRWSLALLLSLVAATPSLATPADAMHPIEGQLRARFPAVSLESKADLEQAEEFVAGRSVSGMRARQANAALRVFYPGSYDETFVAELGEQRVALRAVGARFAPAAAAGGKVFYSSAHESVDVIEVPGAGRSEELLVLHDARAPRVFEYEIVEMRGVAGLELHDGAIRFLLERIAMPMAGVPFQAPPLSLQIDRPWVIDANGERSESAAQWTIVEEEGQARRIRLTVTPDRLAYPIVVDPSFSATGSMGTVRVGHTETLLPSGKVLIAGGYSGTATLNAAELYDPATGTFAATNGTMTAARSDHTATLLANGKVLLAGGFNGSSYSDTAELYDSATGTFTATTGPMTGVRYAQTATLLRNGKVLIAGGANSDVYLNTADLYDPASGTFTATTVPMTEARYAHTATLLPSGKVLIAGGTNPTPLDTAELYDPAGGTNGTFTATTVTMPVPRFAHTATLLPNGKVLIAGGASGAAYLNTALLYDPAGGTNGTFTATTGNMTPARGYHTATLLPNGKVLIAGGHNGAYLNTAQLFDPGAGTFVTAGGNMTGTRGSHTATLLPNGKVLIAGGYNGSAYLNTVEIYDEPGAGVFAATGNMTEARVSHTATLLPNGKVLIAGGLTGGAFANADLFDPAGGTNGTFTAITETMTAPRYDHTATLLPNGKVLIAAGKTTNGATTNTAELYNPAAGASGTFTAITGPMSSERTEHTATLLPNGKVLIAGGLNGAGVVHLNTAELYDPGSGPNGSFTATIGTMSSGRSRHTATLLANGKVLIAGGDTNGGASLATAELYDPATSTFTAISSSMTAVRFDFTATLLQNGKVLLAGGHDNGVSSTAELYDPAGGTNGTFTATGTMTARRFGYTATLLPNGKVLIACGLTTNDAFVTTAELFDPAAVTNGTFTAITGTSTAKRWLHTAVLLPNGKALIAGGTDFITSARNTAEQYDAGLGYSDPRRPVVSSLTNPVCQPGNLALSGSLFTGDSEGSGGSTGSSAANAPLLRLQRVDNEQLLFALSQSFSAASFFSATLNNLSSGHYRVSIVSNAVPSAEKIIEVATTPLLGTYGSASVDLSGSVTVTPTSLPAGYNGAFYPLSTTASGAFTGMLRINASTGVVTVTNAGPVGTYTITVASSTSCGSPSTTFTLDVIGPPASVTATGGTPQSTPVNTPFASPLQATVRDSAGHPLSNVAVTFTAPGSGASAMLSGDSAQTNASGVASITATANGTLGSYNVTAVVGALTATFALTNTPAIPANVLATAVTSTSVSVTWSGTAGATYEVLRQAAGGVTSTVGSSMFGELTDNSATADTSYLYKVRAIAPDFSPYGTPDLATTVIFTDPTLTAGATIVKAAHFSELRTAVNAVRTLAGLTASSFTDVTLTPGSTTVKALHLTEPRAALDAARSSLLLPAISYTRPTISAGTSVISAADINDLRNGVK